MKFRLLMILLLFAAGPTGCIIPPANQQTNTTDEDDDGFFEPDISEDVVPAADGELRVSLINELTPDQLGELIGLEGGLVDLAAGLVEVQFDITLSYDSGDEAVDPERRELDAFTIQLQFPCPNAITVTASVQASLPFVGTVFDEQLPPIVLELGEDGGETSYQCGQVIRVTSSSNPDTGEPDIDFVVEDFVAP